MYFGLIIGLVIWGLICKVIANVLYGIAERKGYHENYHLWAWCFWLSLIGVIISVVIVVTLPEKRNDRRNYGENYYGPRQDDNSMTGIGAGSIGDLYSTSSSNTEKIDNNDAYHKNLFKDDV